MWLECFTVALSYLLGSVTTSRLLCVALGKTDPSTVGSRNPGATNMLRLHGRRLAALTLLGDMAKGVIPVWFAVWWPFSDRGITAVALAVFFGHLYPVYHHFRGGKGVATLLGILLVLHWGVALAYVFSWGAIAWLTRYSSVAGMGAAIFSAFLLFFGKLPINQCVGVWIMTGCLLFAHRENVRRILRKEERRLGSSN